jgi:hypothetical protein
VARVFRTTTVLLVTLCAAPFAGAPASAASDAAIRQQLCLALAERIWPSNTGEIGQYDRNRYFLALGCLN